MRHYFTTRVRVALMLAVLLAVGLGILSKVTNTSLPDMFVKGILTPIRSGVSKLTDKAEQLYGYMFEYELLLAENEALKEQLAQIEDDARYADSVARENERLRDLAELKTAREDFKLVDGYIISWSSNDWSSTFTINTGSNVGIEPGMCVITENGEVVGLVSEVGTNYSVIKSVLDSSLEISATIASSGYNGMVQGGYTYGNADLLRMDYLPTAAVIRNNDQVVTTGSTVYPRNLILGYVVDAGHDDAGIAKFALLKPAADIGKLEQVFIVTEYNVG
jgi:rod shape-determining protein MreC